MKKSILLALIILPLSAFSQSSDVSELSLLRGGELNLDVRLGFNLNGFGPGSSLMGGVTSSRVNSGPGSLITNPAELGFQRRGVLIMDGNPAAGLWSGSKMHRSIISDLESSIRTSTDDTVNDTTAFLKTPDAYIDYTRMNYINAGFPTRLGAFALALPVTERLTAAFSVSRPIDTRIRFNASGISAKLAQEQGTADVSLRFDVLLNASLLGAFDLTMQQVNAGFGYQAWRNRAGTQQLLLGFTATRYEMENRRFFDTDLSGMVVIGGADERFFNNPADVNLDSRNGDSNAFYLRTTGRYRDAAWGYRAGLLYRNKWFTGSLAYNLMPTLSLTDPSATGAASLPIFLVGDDVFGGLDVVLDTLKPAKPNLTSVRDVSKFTETLTWQLPSSVTVGVDVAMGAHTLSLNYSYCLSDFKIQIGDDVYGRRAPMGIGVGLDFRGTDRFATWHQLYIFPLRLLFLDVDGILFQAFRKRTGYQDPHYRIGFRGMLGTGFTEGTVIQPLGDSFTSIPFTPIGFSMGREYHLGENLRVGVTTFAWPDLMLRMALSYSF
jgi:hypothetical protein